MDMKLDPTFIRAERERRAWSQEHLAEVAGLGLRTVQRIEKTGAASYESARSLAAVFGVDVADLRVEQSIPVPARAGVALRPVLGVLGALVAGGALLVTTTSFADQVLMDVSVAMDSADEAAAATSTQVVVEDGALAPNVNFGDLRFSIVPRVQSDDRVLLEVGIYERRGDQEVAVGEPRLITVNGEAAEVIMSAGDSRTLRLAITAQVNPARLPSTLRGIAPSR
jgi:transcriptional regulator with XRE-family HTH domain